MENVRGLARLQGTGGHRLEAPAGATAEFAPEPVGERASALVASPALSGVTGHNEAGHKNVTKQGGTAGVQTLSSLIMG